MKTESRRELLDRLNKKADDSGTRTIHQNQLCGTISELRQLANHQEKVIEQMKWKCEQIAYDAFGTTDLNRKYANEALAFADAPMEGEG